MEEPVAAGAVHTLSDNLDMSVIGHVAEHKGLPGLPRCPGVILSARGVDEFEVLRPLAAVDQDLKVPPLQRVAAIMVDVEFPLHCHVTGNHRRRRISDRVGEERYHKDRRHCHEYGNEGRDGDEVRDGGVGFHGGCALTSQNG